MALLFGAGCLLSEVGLADEPAGPAKSIEKFNLSTGGTGIYRPEQWGLINIGMRNPQDHEVDVLATTYFVGDPNLQYGRRVWLPPRSRRVTWHPIRMPRLEQPGQKIFDLRSMVVSGSSGSESMATNEFGSMQFDQGLLVGHDEPVTAMIVDVATGGQPGKKLATPQDLLLTARFDRGLRYNVTLFGDPLLPASEEVLATLDHLLVASDRIKPDAAGIAAIRRWVAAGGHLWIQAEAVSPELLASLLGDDGAISEVDRVDLTSIHIESVPWAVGPIEFDRVLEYPAPFVRVIAEDVNVEFLVNGWPAAFWKSFGEGRILVTTLGSDAWLVPRKPTDPVSAGGKEFATEFVPSPALSQLAFSFFTPRTPPPVSREIAEEHVRQLIGYAIPSRTLVLGTLGGFTALILLTAIALARRGRLEVMGLVLPGLALASAGVLLGAGWASKSTVPGSSAIIQVVQAVPGSQDVRTSGLAGVYARETSEFKFAGRQGGWLSPDMDGLEGTTRRMVWTDLDHYQWEHLPMVPGLRMAAFQTAGRAEEPVEAVARFDATGVTGKLSLPAGLNPGDGLIATSRGRMGVDLKADGDFVASADSVLEAGEFLSARVLSDEQQRRNRILAEMLTPVVGTTHTQEPILLVWTKPWEVGLSVAEAKDCVGSALVSIPIRWERPPEGSNITIPAPFLSFREVEGPDKLAPSGLYDYRTSRWSERSGPAAGWLGFTIPNGLLPLTIKSATMTFKVLGPIGRLEISTVENLRRKSLKVWDAPVGTLTYQITDPQALKLDSRGRLLLRIDAGQRPSNDFAGPVDPKNKPRLGAADPLSYWQFEDVSLQLTAEVTAAETTPQP